MDDSGGVDVFEAALSMSEARRGEGGAMRCDAMRGLRGFGTRSTG
jgi:hypothetical protein